MIPSRAWLELGLCLHFCIFIVSARHLPTQDVFLADMLVPVNTTKTVLGRADRSVEGSGYGDVSEIPPLPPGVGVYMERMQASPQLTSVEDKESLEDAIGVDGVVDNDEIETLDDEGSGDSAVGGTGEETPKTAAIIDDPFNQEEGMEDVYKELAGGETTELQTDDGNRQDNTLSVLANGERLGSNAEDDLVDPRVPEHDREEGSGQISMGVEVLESDVNSGESKSDKQVNGEINEKEDTSEEEEKVAGVEAAVEDTIEKSAEQEVPEIEQVSAINLDITESTESMEKSDNGEIIYDIVNTVESTPEPEHQEVATVEAVAEGDHSADEFEEEKIEDISSDGGEIIPDIVKTVESTPEPEHQEVATVEAVADGVEEEKIEDISSDNQSEHIPIVGATVIQENVATVEPEKIEEEEVWAPVDLDALPEATTTQEEYVEVTDEHIPLDISHSSSETEKSSFGDTGELSPTIASTILEPDESTLDFKNNEDMTTEIVTGIEGKTENEEEVITSTTENKVEFATGEILLSPAPDTEELLTKELSGKMVLTSLEATVLEKSGNTAEDPNVKSSSAANSLSIYIIAGVLAICFVALVIALTIRSRGRRRSMRPESGQDKETEKALISHGKYKEDSEDNNMKNNEITPLVIKQNSQINKFEKKPNFSSPKNLNTTANEKNIEKDNVLKSTTQAIIEGDEDAKKAVEDEVEEEKKRAAEELGQVTPEKVVVRTHVDLDSIPRKPVIVSRNGQSYHSVPGGEPKT